MGRHILTEVYGKMPPMPENELKCCVSGSFFKFKPEIDRTIDEFRDLGITVLAPEKGWLFIPNRIQRAKYMEFRPLPSERKMSIRQIEDSFLLKIKQADFHYIANFEGYLGPSSALEIGFAMACGVPSFSVEQIKLDEPNDLWLKKITGKIKIAAPKEVKRLFTETWEEWKAALDLGTLEL